MTPTTETPAIKNCYQFASYPDGRTDKPQPNIVTACLLKLENGNKLTPAEREMVTDQIREHNGSYRYMGWSYNFRPYMRRYLYKTQFTGWTEIYAFNRKMLRKVVYGRVDEIVQVDNKYVLDE